MTDAVAKFPGTTGLAQLAQVDVGGELVGIGEAEWTTNGATLIGAVAPFSLVVNEAISARVATAGWLTTANGEVLHYNAVNTGTKTFTIDARAQQDTAAAAIDTATWIGLAVTKRWYNQVIAELIAMQTEMFKDARPNQVLNSDASRRTVMPGAASFAAASMGENFADLLGATKIDAGAAASVAANVMTQGAANNEYAWCAGDFAWRDARASATFKATAIAGIYELRIRKDATHWVSVKQNNGNFTIDDHNGGVSVVFSAANVLTINRWYWLEIELQNTNIIANIYDTLGTVPGVTKASSTFVMRGTSSTAMATTGRHISITSDQAAAQWGGVATFPGGVYVETPTPESLTFNFAAGAQFGGLAFGIDEAADSGPIGKQWTPRVYVPATNRRLDVTQTLPDGSVVASTTYQFSQYVKTSGKGGTGTLIQTHFYSMTSALATVDDQFVQDASEVAWTRKTLTSPSVLGATVRRAQIYHAINVGQTATGTIYFDLPQLEQGSAVTSWRPATADDAPIVWTFASTKDIALAAAGEVDSRDLAGNLFLPWDARLTIAAHGIYDNSGANANYVKVSIDGSLATAVADSGGTTVRIFSFVLNDAIYSSLRHAAGKTRIALAGDRIAGTETFRGSGYAPTFMTITAFRGK